MLKTDRLFESFFLGGFECSTHRLRSGKRLDEIEATHHDRFAREDYLRLHEQGIHTAREGIRWHLIEPTRGRYDFSSVLPMLRAARDTSTQILWDLCHYGYPDWVDMFKPEFVSAFASLAREFGRVIKSETNATLFVSPINEISFFSWAAGEFSYLNPFARNRGNELKEQLVRGAISATEALWDVNPHTRIVQIDPMIHVIPEDPGNEEQSRAAEGYRLSQFEAWDMLGGRLKPHLGGAEKYLDIIGGNYYVHNQWILDDSFIDQTHSRYRPLRLILKEIHERYRRPFFLAETGIEDELRPMWLRDICEEVRAAMLEGVRVEGICLYPIVNHPGWDDDRHCHNGLWDYANEKGEREIYLPLAEELCRQQKVFQQLFDINEKEKIVGDRQQMI